MTAPGPPAALASHPPFLSQEGLQSPPHRQRSSKTRSQTRGVGGTCHPEERKVSQLCISMSSPVRKAASKRLGSRLRALLPSGAWPALISGFQDCHKINFCPLSQPAARADEQTSTPGKICQHPCPKEDAVSWGERNTKTGGVHHRPERVSDRCLKQG